MTYNTFKKKYRPASWKIFCAALLGTTPAFAIQCPAVTDTEILDEIINNLGDELIDGVHTWKIAQLRIKTGVNFKEFNLGGDPIENNYRNALFAGPPRAPTALTIDPAAHPGVGPHHGIPLSAANAAAGNIFGTNPIAGPNKPLAYSPGNVEENIGKPICHYTADLINGGQAIELDIYLTYGLTKPARMDVGLYNDIIAIPQFIALPAGERDRVLVAVDAALTRVPAHGGPRNAAVAHDITALGGAIAAAGAPLTNPIVAAVNHAYPGDVPVPVKPGGMDAGLYHAIIEIRPFIALTIPQQGQVLAAVHAAITRVPAHGGPRDAAVVHDVTALGGPIAAAGIALTNPIIAVVDHAHPPVLVMPVGMNVGLYNAIRVLPAFVGLGTFDGNRVLAAIDAAITAHPAHGGPRNGEIRARITALGIGGVNAAFMQLMIDEVDRLHPALVMPVGMNVGLYNAIRVLPAFVGLGTFDGNRVLAAIDAAITAHPAHGGPRNGEIRRVLGLLAIVAVDAAFEQLMIDEVDHVHPAPAMPAGMDAGLYGAIRGVHGFGALTVPEQTHVLAAVHGASHGVAHGPARDAAILHAIAALGIAAADVPMANLIVAQVDGVHPAPAMPVGMDAGLYGAIRGVHGFGALTVAEQTQVLAAVHGASHGVPHGPARDAAILHAIAALGIAAADVPMANLIVAQVDAVHPALLNPQQAQIQRAHPHIAPAIIQALPAPVLDFAIQQDNLAPVQPGAGPAGHLAPKPGAAPGITYGMLNGRMWTFKNGQPMKRIQ